MSDRCYWCDRDTSDGAYVNVSTDRGVIRCCDICWEKGDEGVDIPLDYTEDREGQPEFNGALNAW